MLLQMALFCLFYGQVIFHCIYVPFLLNHSSKWTFKLNPCLDYCEYFCDEVLLYSTGNYIQSLGVEHDGRQCEKGNVHICMTG